MSSAKLFQNIAAVVLTLAIVVGSMMAYAAPVEYGVDTNIPEKAYAQSFSDIPADHWAFKYISELADRGAIGGYPDGKFRPDLKVTRAEFAKMMTIAAGITPKAVSGSSFSDIKPSDWCLPFVEAARDYMTGYKNAAGQIAFRPDNPALREDIVVAMVKLKGYDVRFADVSILKAMYKDYESISASARGYVAIAVENGLISGYPDDTFRAQAAMSRAEVATILWRAFQYGSDDKVTDIPDSTNPVQEETTQAEDTTDSSYPEESTPEQFSVETLAENVTSLDSMVVGGEGNVYFLQDNKVKKVVSGKVEVVADGTVDFSFDVTYGDMAQQIIDTTPYSYEKEYLAPYLGDNTVFTFKKFTINKLLYDEVNKRVLVFGNFITKYLDYNKGVSNIPVVFDIDNIEDPISVFYYCGSVTVDSEYLPTNSIALYDRDNIYYQSFMNYVYRYNLNSNNITEFYTNRDYELSYWVYSYYEDVSSAGIWNNKYSIITYKDDLCIIQHDPLNNFFKEILIKHNEETEDKFFYYKGLSFSYRNGKYYIFNGTNIFTVDSGNFLSNYILGDDLTIQDGLPISGIKVFSLDDSGSVIFYDETNMAIRRINY